MKTVKLQQRIKSIKAASDFQHKLIDSIFNIMSLKRKAQVQYRSSMENISRELDKYLVTDNGFLTEMVRAFQSYINVVNQNQTALIDGYDNEILTFLAKAKQSKLETDILQKVDFVDQKIQTCKQQVKHFKKLIRQNEQDIQYVSSEVAFKGRINPLSEEEKKALGEKFTDLQNLKRINEQNLQQHVDGMMDLTMLHHQTLDELNEYETVYLEQKASDVYDNFMRAFVLEVSFIRSMSFDVTSILQKVNDRKDQNKKIAFDNLRKRMQSQKGIKQSLWDTYKKWTNSDSEININDNHISPRIRDKWRRVCEYYNSAVY